VVTIGKAKSRELAKLAGIDLWLPRSQQTPNTSWLRPPRGSTNYEGERGLLPNIWQKSADRVVRIAKPN
jgi:hypothetical protein